MINNQVDEHPHASLFASLRKFNEVSQRAIVRIDVVVICNVVAPILIG